VGAVVGVLVVTVKVPVVRRCVIRRDALVVRCTTRGVGVAAGVLGAGVSGQWAREVAVAVAGVLGVLLVMRGHFYITVGDLHAPL